MSYICIIQKPNDMYSIEIYNHETKTQTQRFSFDNKREANQFVNKNAEKRGFDFFCKSDRSLEYQKLY